MSVALLNSGTAGVEVDEVELLGVVVKVGEEEPVGVAVVAVPEETDV